MTYKIIEILDSKVIEQTHDDNSVSYIPFDESNSDYQRYLRWLENPGADESGTL